MSRAYTLRLKESLRRTVVVRDGVRAALEVLEVLPREQMAELLRARLGARGFVQDALGALVRDEPDGVRVSVDPVLHTVTLSLAGEQAIDLEAEASVPTFEERHAHDERTGRAALQGELEADAAAVEATLRADVAERLSRRLADLRGELDRVTHEVVADGLERRAAQLGQITELSRDDATGELTIRVKL